MFGINRIVWEGEKLVLFSFKNIYVIGIKNILIFVYLLSLKKGNKILLVFCSDFLRMR